MTLEEFFDRYPAYNTEKIKKFIERRGIDAVFCKCGDVKRIKSDGYIGYLCYKPECDPRRGRKRPDHSKLMKEKAATGNLRGIFEKGRKNPFINTAEWKRRVMRNKGISFDDNMTDDEIHSFFNNNVKQKISHGRQAIENTIVTLYHKYKDKYDLQEVDVDGLSSLPDDIILTYRKLFNSIKTIEANKNGKGLAKRFKRIELSGFKYNIDGVESIITRSSYEANYIKWFEKNHIWWSYETLAIPTMCGYYVPDFIFHYRGKKYILEVKGFLVDERAYFNEKIRYCIVYAKNNGYDGMLFTYDEFPSSIEQLISQKVEIK